MNEYIYSVAWDDLDEFDDYTNCGDTIISNIKTYKDAYDKAVAIKNSGEYADSAIIIYETDRSSVTTIVATL